MRVEKVESSEFRRILDEVRLDPYFLFVSAHIKFHLEGIMEEDLELDLWRIRDGDRLAYAVVKHNSHKSLVFLESNCYDPEFCMQIAKLFADALYDTVKNGDYVFGFGILEPLVDLFERNILDLGIRRSHPFKILEDRVNLYHLCEDGRKLVEEKEPELPEGYRFERLKPQHAAEILADQLYGKITSPKPYERTLSLLPSVGVFTEDTNELVSYEFLDVTGAITSQFTRHPHRRKGIGSAVEWKICAETWKKVGLIPLKAVSHNRPRVLKLSDNSPLWTQKLDESGTPINAKFFMYCKTDMPKIEFYEN
ncbi:unnamed protein product [Bursaphelenchus xylophilus]|uniref:Glycine N-acyltransferase-like protein n=1 Tax=Bursaphelenchus xylophilus TaxID=6326 RepID=A0A1I7SBK8_BURXY|nr:unnamed protein product [Bursaphelenchus xylophilus]CAG9114431.1 unnamed protein product [Bursaphelenchus xylophilus]